MKEHKEISKEKQKKLFAKERLSKKDFSEIYDFYYQPVYDFTLKRVSNEHTAQDLASVIFEKVLKSIEDFQWQGISVGAWIFRIARNTIIDFYRKNDKYKGNVSLDDVSDFIESKAENALEMIIDDEYQTELYDAIRQLKDEDQYLIYYKYFEGFGNRKIAQILNLSETNIGTRLHRIRKKLKNILDSQKK